MKFDAKAVAGLTLPAGKSDVIHFDDTLPGFGLRLRISGGRLRRSWVVQYRRLGVSRRLLIGPAEVLSVEQARAAAKKTLAKIALGQDPQAENAERRAKSAFTLRAVAGDYLAAKEPNVRRRTFAESQRYLTGAYFKPLHNMGIDQITRRDVAARLLVIEREGGKSTASQARSVLSAMYGWAMGMGIAESNPVIGTRKPEPAKPRERVLDDDELAEVWRACKDDNFGRVVRLAMLSGQRRSEVGGMTWSELDLERGTWTIPAARAKNHREHTLPLPALALSIIGSVPRVVGREPLFSARGAGFTAWTQGKDALDGRLGDKVKPWTIHDLRRTAATRMCDLGVAPHVVEQILNHQSGHRAGIVGVYNRSRYEREVRAAVALWADHIRSITSGGERKVVAFPER